jgi:ubiquinone/menaquinone biosynthesis C-methylase UbiE
MAGSQISKDDIGTPHYYELLHQEAKFWERVNLGEVDTSAAIWRKPDIARRVNGDLLARTLDLTAARGRRVLELGCGSAGLSIELARRGCMVDGVDISMGRVKEGMRRIAEQRAAEHWRGDARLIVSDLNRLALAPDTYDVVLAAAVLHHVLDLEYLIGAVYRALKPGSTLICLDHMEPSELGRLIRYGLLTILPTEVPYWQKPGHAFKRLMARVFKYSLPQVAAPVAFTLPERSPFEDISGRQAVTLIRGQFVVETYQTYLAFTEIVAGHLQLGSPQREVNLVGWLRRLDDWLIRHRIVHGETYFLVAHKP